MSRIKPYWYEIACIAVGVAAAAAILPHGREAAFNVGLLTAAALCASALTGRRRVAA